MITARLVIKIHTPYMQCTYYMENKDWFCEKLQLTAQNHNHVDTDVRKIQWQNRIAQYV